MRKVTTLLIVVGLIVGVSIGAKSKRPTAKEQLTELDTIVRALEGEVAYNKQRINLLMEKQGIKNPTRTIETSTAAIPPQATYSDGYFHNPLKIGDRGRIYGATIEQIVDNNNFLAEIMVKNPIGRYAYDHELVWIMGVDATGHADGTSFPKEERLELEFFITGTKKYNTAMNSVKTVFVIEAIR